MNYNNKVVAVTGFDGFIGSELVAALEAQGARVVPLLGDVRDPLTFSVIDYTYDYLFHFADPSSQVLFKRQAMYAADVTINGFLNAARTCRAHGVKLIYPSTGLLSQDQSNEYARCKKICEDIQLGENLDALAIRIFATYGPGEGHKRDYASVPYLFIRDMVAGKSPVVFGDGNQVRDFVYIDDVIAAILTLAEECNDPIVDVGMGESHSFNEIIELTNQALFPGEADRYIEPVYVEKPGGYVQETSADPTRLSEFYKLKTSFAVGIERTVFHEKAGDQNDSM